MAVPPADGGGLQLTITPQDPPQGVLGAPPAADPFRVAQNDATEDYRRWRERTSGDALEERARQRYGLPADPAPITAPAVQVTTPPAAAPSPPPPPSMPPTSGAPIGPGDAPLPRAGGGLEALPSAAGAVARDVRQGVVEAPRAIAGGAMDGVREMIEAADSIGTWLQGQAPAVVPVPPGAQSVPFLADAALREIFGQDVRLPGIETFAASTENPLAALAKIIPQLDKPQSVTGALEHGVSQFLVGFLGGGKALKALGGPKGVVTGGMARGAFSDALAFDPNDENLAKLLKDHGVLKGPVTEFLATDPKDSEALNRLRRALEGVGIGVATEGLVGVLRVYRARRWQKAQDEGGRLVPAAAELERQRAQHGSLDEQAFAGLGDVADTGPLARVEAKAAAAAKATDTGAGDAATAQAIAGAKLPVPDGIARVAGDGPRLIVNFARINSPDDVKAVLRDAAEAFKSDIDAARRGVQSHEQTRALADALGMSVDDLLSRRAGQPLNAEEALAARRLWAATTERLLELARIASAPTASPVDLYNFRRMMAVHYAVQAEVIAARTETARALQAWRIPAGADAGIERSRAVTEALAGSGGDVTAREMARRLSALMDSGVEAGAISEVIRAGTFARTWDAMAEVWVNALLSSPKTHIVNTMSNSMALLSQVYERRVAEELSRLRAPDGIVAGVAPGEAQAMLFGLVEAQKDAWRMAWLAFREGQRGQAIGKVDRDPMRAALSAEAFGLQDGAVARTVDALGVAARVPSRLLGAEDEFFKTIGYRMELRAQALRQARSEGLDGVALQQRVADILKAPPEHIRLQASDAALYSTFTQHAGDFAEAVIAAREAFPPMLFVVPFVRTPVNILKYSFERTPMAFAVRQWREDIAAGGARADVALARMATGTSIMLAAYDYADRGLITGGMQGDTAQREVQLRQGMQPYSIKVGDKWVAYDRADPFGMLLGFAADMAEIGRRADLDGDKLDEYREILSAGIAAVSATTLDKSYLQGAAEFFAMVEDPKRRAYDWVGKQQGSAVPSLVNAARLMRDPVTRETMNGWDFVTARVPEFSKTLIAKRDLWGEPIRPSSGFGATFDALSPAKVATARVSPIDQEMERLRLGIERIDKKASFDGVPVNFRDHPRIYDAYVRLAGNDLKLPQFGDRGAKDFLDAIVDGKAQDSPIAEIYRISGDGPDGGRADIIRGVVAQARQAARAYILAAPEFADFQAEFARLRREHELKNQQLQQVTPPDVPRPQVMPPGARDVRRPGDAAPLPSSSPRIQ